MPVASWRRALDEPHVPLRVAWSPTLGYAPVDPEVLAICQSAVAGLADRGTDIVEESSVFPTDPVAPWLVLTGAGNLRTVAHLRDTAESDLLDDGVRASADWARRLSASDVLAAQDATHFLNLTLVSLFRKVSVLLTPTVAAKAPGVDTDGGVRRAP